MYDFDAIVDRRNTASLKWDVGKGELPMWVADMDFQTAPEIREALERRVKHGVFGYSVVPDEWAQAIAGWWRRRHGFEIDPGWLTFCTGAIPAISSVVRKLTTPNENVVILTPVYNIFFNSIVNNGCRALQCPLSYADGRYEIDWDDLKAKLADPQTALMILCNPHNPTGRIWERDTLARVGELCAVYGVTVISDEVHCDLTDPGFSYTPFAAASETCRDISVTCIAPTKAFNIAGLQTAAVMVPDPLLHHKVWRALNTDEVAEPNAFAIEATIAAFERGEAWLDALREYIHQNKQAAKRFLEAELPMLRLTESRATYLLWIDCSAVTDDTDALTVAIRERTGLYLSAGAQFGGNGRRFVRMNIACPRSVLMDGLERLKRAIV